MMFSRSSLSHHAANVLLIIAVLCHIAGAAPNYLTIISRGFTSTEIGNPFFDCYTEPSNPNAVITTGRYADTRNIRDPRGPNPPPPDPETFLGEDQTSIIYHTELNPIQPYGSYGVFYCESSVDGMRTVVPTIFLRSDAYFVPSGGRFTQIVTAGQVNVSIQFDRAHPSDIDDNLWRFNGTDNFFRGPDIAYTFTDPIQASQEGIYEIHVTGLRSQVRGGLMRLIVIECPLGRYDSSSGCVLTCSSCYNGGICDDETGKCICAPGFKGETCETGCGGNRFGRSCEYRCNTSIDDFTACRGIHMCLPDPYGCSCAPGFKGLNCTAECDQGEFGASCTETCHCVSGECDRFTGVCTGGSMECQHGWAGSSCQKCLAGMSGRNCLGTIQVENTPKNEGQPNIQFSCRRDGGEFLSSVPPVVGLYRVTDDSDRFSDGGINSIGNIHHESATIDFFEVDYVKAEDLFVCIIYDVNSYRSAEVTADLNILPRLTRPPLIQETSPTSITLSWDGWMAGVDIGDPPLIGYNVYYKEVLPGSSPLIHLDRGNALDVSQMIDGLSPDRDYLFGVSAVRDGDGGEGPLKNVTASTSCLPPTGVLSHVTVHQVSSPEQLLITWQFPTADDASANCRGGFTNISIYFSSTSDVSSEGSVQFPFDSAGSYYLGSVVPGTQYSVYMTLRNKDSEGPRSQASFGMTFQTQASVSSALVPWALFGITLLICAVVIIILISVWKRRKADPQPPKSRTNPKTDDDQPTYENPTFESPPINTYESLKRVEDNTADDAYVNVMSTSE